MSDNGYPFDPDWCIRPGVYLADEMTHRCGTARSARGMFARGLGVDITVIDGLLDGSWLIDDDIATRLSGFLGTSKQMWLNLESTYRNGLEAGKQDVSDE